jgi:hypothetical protein
MTPETRNGITQRDKPSPVAVASGQDKPRKGLLLPIQPESRTPDGETAPGLSRCDPVRFALVLQAMPDPSGAPAIIRLRRFLKMALRSYGMKCIRCEAIEPALGAPSMVPPASRQPRAPVSDSRPTVPPLIAQGEHDDNDQ